MIERYVRIPGAYIDDKFYSVFDLTFVEDDYFGNRCEIKIDGHRNEINKFDYCVYDIKEKCYKEYSELETNQDPKFVVGETVYTTNNTYKHTIKKEVIKSISYKVDSESIVEYDPKNYPFYTISKNEKSKFILGELVLWKSMKPIYEMESGTVIEYEMYISKLEE